MRELLERVRDKFRRRGATGDAADLGGQPGRRLPWKAIGGVVVLFLVLYYPVGMMLAHKVNDDVDYQTPAEFQVEGGSRAVSMAAALIDREVTRTKWVANSPIIFPSSLLDNMPNFQMGLIYAMSRFAIEMTDALGRTRGSSQADADLDKASGLLKYDGTIWMWEPRTSLMPTASAERQYVTAERALMAFNRRLGDGRAVFDRRADNLISFLSRVEADLGSSSGALDARAMESNAGWFDFKADNIFYATKGRLYGYYMLLRELGADFESVLAEKNVGNVWAQMMQSLRIAADMDPLIVANGANDGFFVPSHMAAQGFYLLRARTQLREVENILLK